MWKHGTAAQSQARRATHASDLPRAGMQQDVVGSAGAALRAHCFLGSKVQERGPVGILAIAPAALWQSAKVAEGGPED
eukprot:507094-Pelagomonas_calceolata.AAC.2